MADQERSLDEWAYRLQEIYEGFRKPHWRVFAPKKTWAHTQRVIFALFYQWRESNPGPPGEKTGAGMERFLRSFARWASQIQGDERTTCHTLLVQFAEGPGQMAAGNPEAEIRAALRPMHKRAALALLLRLAAEIV